MVFSRKIVSILFRPKRRTFHLSLFSAAIAMKKTLNVRPVLNPKGHAKSAFWADWNAYSPSLPTCTKNVNSLHFKVIVFIAPLVTDNASLTPIFILKSANNAQCTKLVIPCNFKLSAQGRHNDIKLHPSPLRVSSYMAIVPVNDMNNVDSVSGFSGPGGIFSITNKSVYYCHQSGLCLDDGYSCHGCVEQVNCQEKESTVRIASWIHVFLKFTKSSSCRLQAASIAYLEEPTTKNARHHCNRRVKRKHKKQNQLLTEVVVPAHIKKIFSPTMMLRRIP